jgi:hypothetical protein
VTVMLNVSVLPRDARLYLTETRYIRMREYLDEWRPILSTLVSTRRIMPEQSFGFAMMAPMWGEEPDAWAYKWDNPHEYIWFAGGWGPDRDRYVANAVRKIRPLLRCDLESSTQHMVLNKRSDLFRDTVDQTNDDGDFEWGDFACGGAVRVNFGDLELVGACSAFRPFEDHLVTQFMLGDLVRQILAAKFAPASVS